MLETRTVVHDRGGVRAPPPGKPLRFWRDAYQKQVINLRETYMRQGMTYTEADREARHEAEKRTQRAMNMERDGVIEL